MRICWDEKRGNVVRTIESDERNDNKMIDT